MKIVIVGANGGLGLELTEMLRQASCEIIPFTLKDLDIRSENAIKNSFSTVNMDLIIYSKGFEDVYKAEENEQLAYDVNATGALNLAKFCKSINIPLMYLSTAFVFDGTKDSPYKPDDTPNPINIFGKTKLAGEDAIRETLDKHYIIRSSKLFGLKKFNFVDDLIEKAKSGQDFKLSIMLNILPL